MTSPRPNAQQTEDWNDVIGRTWATLHERLDRQLGPIGRAAMAKAEFSPGRSVLDIGCGCGETSLEIAAAIKPGVILGIDISEMLLKIAREAAEAASVANVRFAEADAQVEALPHEVFDVLYSRFGVMFFDDPVAAFVNLRTALKPQGRLAFCCWRPPAENIWLSLPMRAVAHLLPPMPPADPDAPGPFAFADPERVSTILDDAGFADVVIEKFDVATGGDNLEDSVFAAMRMGQVGAALREAGGGSDALKTEVAAALGQALLPYVVDGVVKLPAAAWIVSATKG